MDLSVDRESRFVRKNEKKENKCPLKNKMYFELNRMMVFFNYVFNWLFGLSFHKYHEEDFLFMQYGCDAIWMCIFKYCFVGFFSITLFTPVMKTFFLHSKLNEYLKLEFWRFIRNFWAFSLILGGYLSFFSHKQQYSKEFYTTCYSVTFSKSKIGP